MARGAEGEEAHKATKNEGKMRAERGRGRLLLQTSPGKKQVEKNTVIQDLRERSKN